MAPQAERLLDRFEEMERAVERDLRRAHKRLKQSIPSYLFESRPLNLLAAPIIYSMIVPIALLDVWISLYQWICFPLFGIRTVQRRITSSSTVTSFPIYFCWIVAMCETRAAIRALTCASDGSN